MSTFQEEPNFFQQFMSGLGKRVQPRPNAEPAKILTLHKTSNSYTNEYSYPQKKGFLKKAFGPAAALGTGFALTTAFKLAVSTSIRSTDVSMGLGSAITGAIVCCTGEVTKDYRDVKKKNSSLKFGQIIKQITKEHYKKYGIKIATGFGTGFAGAWGADLFLDNFDIGEKLKEWTKPLRSLTGGIGAWIGEQWTDIKERFLSFFSEKKSIPLPEKSSSNSLTTIMPPLGSIAEPATLPTQEQSITAEQTSEPVTEIAVPEPLTPRQQLAQLLDTSEPGSSMDKAVYNALNGKPSAMNEVIDGLYNGRHGFTKNRELAATLLNEFTTPLEGKPVAELSKGQQDLLLKLAFMQFNPEHAKFGIESNPLHSLEIVEKLGRSWPGAPELAPSIPTIEPEEVAEKISCTITQNPPGIQPQFKVHCLPSPETLKVGDSVNLGFDWHNGIHEDKTMIIGESVDTMPSRDYFKIAMRDILKNAKAPAATAQLTPEI